MKPRSCAGTTPGARYGDLNQDSCVDVAFEHLGKTLHLWGVFDGHAPLGEFASHIAKKTIISEVERVFKSGGQFTDDKLTKIFETAHKAILAFYQEVPKKYKYVSQKMVHSARPNSPHCDWYKCGNGFRPIEFGTTASIVLFEEGDNYLIVANVGDSTIKLIQREEGDELAFHKLSEDHTSNNPSEVRRIQCLNSCFISAEGYLVAQGGGIPDRETHELQMTRALGHKLFASHGIITQPSITRHYILDEDCFLVLATDGLWDFINDSELLGHLTSNEEPKEAVNALEGAIEGLAQASVDNMAVVVIHLNV